MQRLVEFFEKSLERIGVIAPVKAREGYTVSNTSSERFVDYMTAVQANLTPPNEQNILSALSRIRQAVAENEAHDTIISGVSPQDVEDIVDWTVNNTRMHIDGGPGNNDLSEYSVYFNKKSLGGACGYCSSLAMLPINELGLEGKLPNAYNFEMKYGTSHAFAVVTAPVKDDAGQIVEKSYLVDASYKQFCVPFKHNGEAYNCEEMPGYYLAQTDEGAALLDDLLVRGYTELTDRKAKLYLDSFNKNLPVFDKVGEYIPQMRAFHYDDYDRQEFIDWGVNVSLPDAKNIPKAP